MIDPHNRIYYKNYITQGNWMSIFHFDQAGGGGSHAEDPLRWKLFSPLILIRFKLDLNLKKGMAPIQNIEV